MPRRRDVSVSGSPKHPYRRHTFDFSNGSQQDILLVLLIGNILHDFVDDSLGELSLFVFLGLLLIADPRIQDSLDFGVDGSLLLEDEGFAFELGSFLGAAWLAFRDCLQRLLRDHEPWRERRGPW